MMDYYDICFECEDDYFTYDEDGNLVCTCLNCPFYNNWRDE